MIGTRIHIQMDGIWYITVSSPCKRYLPQPKMYEIEYNEWRKYNTAKAKV